MMQVELVKVMQQLEHKVQILILVPLGVQVAGEVVVILMGNSQQQVEVEAVVHTIPTGLQMRK